MKQPSFSRGASGRPASWPHCFDGSFFSVALAWELSEWQQPMLAGVQCCHFIVFRMAPGASLLNCDPSEHVLMQAVIWFSTLKPSWSAHLSGVMAYLLFGMSKFVERREGGCWGCALLFTVLASSMHVCACEEEVPCPCQQVHFIPSVRQRGFKV